VARLCRGAKVENQQGGGKDDSRNRRNRHMGAPEFMADGLVELYMMISQGMADMVVETFKDITGHEPRGFGQFAHDFASAFEGTSA